MSEQQPPVGIWPDKGEMSERNPRYLHARLLAGSGYTPEPLAAPEGWFETHGTSAFPIERIPGDDWAFLEASEDLSAASRIHIALAVMRGFQHVRDSKSAIIWDTKPEHIVVEGFCPPDDVSRIQIKFIDLETIYLIDQNAFSTLGEPTPFTLNCIARQQQVMVQGGLFDPEAEVVESIIGCIQQFDESSPCPSPLVSETLGDYWASTIDPGFDSFAECLLQLGARIGPATQRLQSPHRRLSET